MSDVPGDGSGAELPLVKLIISDDREIDSTYQNLEVVCEPGHAPEVFNKHLDPECYCMCLAANEHLIGDPIELLVSKIHNKGIINAVYCDVEFDDNLYPYHQRHPSWEPGLLKGQILINSPLLFKPDGQNKYNEKLKSLYHFQFILQYGLTNFLVHHAATLFKIDEQGHDLQQEIETIQQCLGQ